MNSLALANQKGGVGKTTTAVHLAHGLAMGGHQVVLIDLDPQGNATVATQGMGPAPADGEPADRSTVFAPLRRLTDGLWILPSPGADRTLPEGAKPDVARLRQLAEGLAESGVDWLIVDCPPRMDVWGLAGLQLCEQVLLPVQAEFFAMHGLSQMLQTLAMTGNGGTRRARLLGILVTMLDPSVPVQLEVESDLRANLGDRLLDTRVYRDPLFVEAASHGVTLFDYRLDSPGARSYAELVREVRFGRPSSG